METSTEQAPATTEAAPNNEQEHNEEGMEETEDYSFDGEDYRHFVPRGRGGFRGGFDFPMRGGPPRFRGRGFGPRGPMFRGANNGFPFEGPPRPNCPPGPAGPRFRGPPPFDPSWGPMGATKSDGTTKSHGTSRNATTTHDEWPNWDRSGTIRTTSWNGTTKYE
uniref:Transcription elongation regulator 1 n=1 Tax=Apis cerana TaxID=7461 RepID=V9ILN9_APICE